MKRYFGGRAPLALLVISGTALLGIELWNPRAASTDATACTLYTYMKPGSHGRCVSSPNTNCYVCEYSNEAGTQTCAEYPDGSSPSCRKGPFYPSPNP